MRIFKKVLDTTGAMILIVLSLVVGLLLGTLIVAAAVVLLGLVWATAPVTIPIFSLVWFFNIKSESQKKRAEVERTLKKAGLYRESKPA